MRPDAGENQCESAKPLREELWTASRWTSSITEVNYLSIAVAGLTILLGIHFSVPAVHLQLTTQVGMGRPTSFFTAVIVLLATLLAWWRFHSTRRRTGVLLGAVGLWLSAWLVSFISMVKSDGNLEVFALVPPFILLLVLLKPPSRSDVQQALGFWVVSLVLVILAYFAAKGLGFQLSPMQVTPRYLVGFDWDLPRIAGPFSQIAYTGAIGAAAAVAASLMTLRFRFIGVGIGLFLLAMSESRTAILGAFTGGATLLLVWVWHRSHRSRVRLPLFAVAGGTSILVAGLLYLSLRGDLTANGRSAGWATYIMLWREHPLIGVGGSLNGHGHSIYLDPLAKYGLAIAVPLTILLVLTLFRSVREAQVGPGGALALLMTLAVSGIGDTMWTPLYLTVPMIPVLLLTLYLTTSSKNASQVTKS